MPLLISSSIRFVIICADFLIPSSSSGPVGSREKRSNHAGIWKPVVLRQLIIPDLEGVDDPELSVTGMVLAVGQTILT